MRASGDAQTLDALEAGASGYLLKSMLRMELRDTIRLVHAGKRYVPASITYRIARTGATTASLQVPSERG